MTFRSHKLNQLPTADFRLFVGAFYILWNRMRFSSHSPIHRVETFQTKCKCQKRFSHGLDCFDFGCFFSLISMKIIQMKWLKFFFHWFQCLLFYTNSNISSVLILTDIFVVEFLWIATEIIILPNLKRSPYSLMTFGLKLFKCCIIQTSIQNTVKTSIDHRHRSYGI